MSDCVDIKVTTPKGVVEVPNNAVKGTVCPYRADYFQTECWRCDYCGRNEAYEHGASFQTVTINGFNFDEEAIDTTKSKIKDGWYIFQYGCKEVQMNIKYLGRWCDWEMEEIHQAIITLRETGEFHYMNDYIKDYDGTIILYLENKPYVVDNYDDGIIRLIGDYTEPQYKTFIHLIEWQEENHMSLAEWEDIYGYDI